MATVSRGEYAASFPYATPVSLDQLRGPTSGRVRVPTYVDPRPDPVFVLEEPSSRLAMYGAVVRAGTVEDQCVLLDGDSLVYLWASLTLPAPCRQMWESRFPELAGA